jgi:hypothetical protein
MRRVYPTLCFVLGALFAHPQPAAADWWDWLQELSGPGPFKTEGNVMWSICPGPGTVFRPYDNAGPPKLCVFVDVRRFVNWDDDNFLKFGRVRLQTYDFGVAWEVRRAVDVGLGFGVMHFAANGTGSNRLSITPLRTTVKPLLLLADLLRKGDALERNRTARRWASILKYYARLSVIPGTIDATNFGVSTSLSDFKAKNDRVASAGFLVDFSELLR